MLALSTPLPQFTLPEPNNGNQKVNVHDYDAAPALLVTFICNHCPFVKHIRSELIQIAKDYAARGLAMIAINSNDAGVYPEDSPEKMAAEAQLYAYPFVYLYDASQQVAKDFHAACTPDFYLFDRDRRLVYRGRLDASTPGNNLPLTGSDLRRAIDAVLDGHTPTDQQHPSVGCNIKWKPGNQP